MTLQASLNNEALEYFPAIRCLIKKADDFSANQMRCKTVDVALNSFPSVINMNQHERRALEGGLVQHFILSGWCDA